MNPMKEWDVITVGDVFVDIVLGGFTAWPRPGEEVFADRLHRAVGGGAAITACGLAKLGERVAVLAAVGESDGDWLAASLQAGGVDTHLIRRSGDQQTGLAVSISTPEDRAFFTHASANRALPELLRDAQVQRELTRARLVHFACALDPDLLADLAGKPPG
ncbi:MAG: carbohydrate kinase family protein [Blastocatellia bacterium]